MATYPTIATLYGSDPEPISKPAIDRAEDGTARARSFANDKARIKITHPWLDATEKAALDAFYLANRLLAITYVSPSDGVSRTCLFAAAPAYKRQPNAHWDATVLLEEA